MNQERWSILTLHLERQESSGREFSLIHLRRDGECGTVCCAIGECTMIPQFVSMGVGWDAVRVNVLLNGVARWFDKFASEFFGITADEAVALFSGWTSSRVEASRDVGLPTDGDCLKTRDPRAVARRMRLLAKKYGIEIEEIPPKVSQREVDALLADTQETVHA